MVEVLKQKKNLIIVIVILIVGVGYYIFNRFTEDDTDTMEFNILEVAENKNEDESEEDVEDDMIVVHITGAVKSPGIVRLKEDSRIEDAIEAAGGLTEDSDISGVNLAYQLDDGVKIRIPTVDDSKNEDEEEGYVTEDSGSNVIMDNESGGKSSSSLVNINKADQAELETLPGIGPSIASRIIEYRESKGKFSKIDDIKNVTGIGDSKFANIKDLITVK